MPAVDQITARYRPGSPLIRPYMPNVGLVPGVSPQTGAVTGAVPGSAVSQVTPGNTLRGTQISPVTSARTAGAAAATTGAMNDVANINRPAMSQAQQQSAISQVQGGGIRYSGGQAVMPGQANAAAQGGAQVLPGQARTQVMGGGAVAPGQARTQVNAGAAVAPGQANTNVQQGRYVGAGQGQTQVAGGPNIPASVDPRVAAAQKTQADALAQVQGANRGAIAGQARGEFNAALAPSMVRGGASVGAGVGTREATRSGQVDRAVEDMLGTDPLERERRLRAEYAGALGPSQLAAGAAVNPEASARLRDEEGRSDRSASALEQINRSKIAQDQLKAFDIEDAEARQNRIKGVSQDAARFGRLGQGGTENRIGEVLRQSEKDRQALGHRLAAETAAGDIDDAFRREGVFSGREGQLAAREAAERGERRGERDYTTGIAEGNLTRQRDDARSAIGLAIEGADRETSDAYGRIGTLADLEAREYGQSAGRRGELRGERDYATGIEERNVDRANRSRELATELGEARGDAGMRDVFDRYGIAERGAGQAFGEDQSLREEARGERGYRDQLDTANVERELFQRGREREEERGERDYATGIEERNLERGLGQRARERDELRGERDYATGIDRENIERDIAVRRGERDELRGERDYATDLERENLEREIGVRRGERDELRGERDYETGLEERNIGRSLDQRAREREEERGERGYRDDLELGNIDRDLATRQFGMQFGAGEADRGIADQFQRLGAFSDLEQRSRGADIADTESLRGERGYQDSLAREANQNQVNERLMEEEFYGNDFNRAATQANAGYGDDPVSKYLAAAGQYGDEAESAFGDLGEMLRIYSMSNAMEGMKQPVPQQQPVAAGGQFGPGEFDWQELLGLMNPGQIYGR
jgi:hypothetical protein